MRPVLKYMDEFNMQTQYAASLEFICYVGASYSDTCYADELEDTAHYANESELYLQRAFIRYEEDPVSIQIIADDMNLRPPLKWKKMNFSQTVSYEPHGPRAGYSIRGTHYDSYNT